MATEPIILPDPPASDKGSSPKVAALLIIAGGFLDAFTYVGHGKVFANSMTGNVVLIGAYAAAGDGRAVLSHIPPIIAFLAGVFMAHRIRLPHSRKYLTSPALACLFIEIVFLMAAAFLPASFPDILLVLGITFVAAMQNTSFNRLGPWTYNSVMTTGNLRRFAEAFFKATMRNPEPGSGREARAFGLVCCCFLAGATLGAFTTPLLLNLSLWIPVILLGTAFFLTYPGR